MGQNFSSLEQKGHKLDRREVRRQRAGDSQRRRKYLRLQADPRRKQNREDLQLLPHFQGLFIILKEKKMD